MIVTVCKNTIAANNKRDWVDPKPAIRIARTPGAKADEYAHEAAIVDKNGEIVAVIHTTTDGQPIVKCGAKVAITTEFPVRKLK